jgi:plasmid maintenance system antidote protein VapI
MSACQDEIDALKKALSNTAVSRNNTNTGTMVSSEVLSGTITNTASSTIAIAKNEVTQLIQKAPAITETSLIELQ